MANNIRRLAAAVLAFFFLPVSCAAEADEKPEQKADKDASAGAAGNSAVAGVSAASSPLTVVGYYASWSAYSGYTPDKIPADKTDVISYAFAKIDGGLKIALGDPGVDAKNFAALAALKRKYPALKTVVSVGGWNGSGKFSDAALTSESRSAFAASAVAFVRKYGFDGIDVDWEYPVSGGLSSNTARAADKGNFTLLMAALRKALDAAGAKDNKHYLLSFAGASESFYAKNVQLDKLAQYADYGFLMAYDMHGSWNKYTDFNAPLYAPPEASGQPKWNCDAAVRLWTNGGFPKSKMILGIPFYGNVYDGVKNANNGLYQKYASVGALPFDGIASKYLGSPSYKRYFHETAKVPWLFGNSVFVSYEDAQSAALKARYIAGSGLKGAGVWELSQNRDGTLLGAIRGETG